MSDMDLTFISLSPHDFPDVVDCDGSCHLAGRGGAPYACLPHAGLCWPEDSLTVVIMDNDDDPDDFTVVDNPDVCADDPDVYTSELLEDLRVAASLPPGRHGLQQTTGRGEGLLFGPERESAPPDMNNTDVMGGGGRGGVCSGSVTRLPVAAVHAVLSDRSCTTTTSSSLETESPPPLPASRLVVPTNKQETKSPPPPPPVSRLVVPRKKRDKSVKRGKRLWSLDILSIITACSGGGSHGKDGDDSRRNANAHVHRRLLGASRLPRKRQITQTRRACSHCDSTETPQWRAGPDGSGTLCNACGIRYTMNKLLPEYRPSTSPSFWSDKHSNRHMKVVRLREKRVQEKVVNLPAATEHGDLMVMDVCKYTDEEEEGKREDCQQNEAGARPW